MSLSRHCLLVAGIFGMNLRSYLEEHVVRWSLKSKNLLFLSTRVTPIFYGFVFTWTCYHYHTVLLDAVCILANNGWDNCWCCCSIFPHVFLSQNKEDTVSRKKKLFYCVGKDSTPLLKYY